MVDSVGLLVALAAAIVAAYVYFVVSARGTDAGSAPRSSEGSAAETTGNDAKKREKKNQKQGTHQQPPPKQKQKPKQTRAASKPSSHPRFVRRFGGHHGNILAMAPSPNGEWMATSGADGMLRVTRVEREKGGGGGGGASDVYLQTKIEDGGGVPDKVCALSWEADCRTVACALARSDEVRFYRMRRRKDDAADADTTAAASDHTHHANHHSLSAAYELAELVRRRFSTEAKLDYVTACEVDGSSSSSSDKVSLVLTSGDSKAHRGQKTTVAWDGRTGHALGEMTTGGGDVRLSRDGRFLCGRCDGESDQVKIFEVLRKKVKGEVEPQFDRISPGKVMTLVAKVKVTDVAFGYSTDRVCDKAIVCGTDGTVQVWNLNVEYRAREDPKLLCSISLDKGISAVASSFNDDRVAIVTVDGALHLLRFSSAPQPSISIESSIESFHPDGVGDVQFCSSGSQVYTRGDASKDVFSWST